MTVAPVVVRPEIDSKMASMTLSCSDSDRMNGVEPNIPRTIQNNAVTRNPSRMRKSDGALRVGNQSTNPAKMLIAKAVANGPALPSLATSPKYIEGSMATLNSMSSTPIIRSDTVRCIRRIQNQRRTSAQSRRCDCDRSGTR